MTKVDYAVAPNKQCVHTQTPYKHRSITQIKSFIDGLATTMADCVQQKERLVNSMSNKVNTVWINGQMAY